MQNESRSERTPETEPKPELVKPSKMDRIKSAAVTAGISMIPVGLTVGTALIGYKTGRMQFDAAKLNLETAKLAAAAVTPKS